MAHPPDSTPDNAMFTDILADNSQDVEIQSQQQTQEASQQLGGGLEGHLWGFLQPCSSTLTRIDFWKIKPVVTIGRHPEQNDVVLPGFKVSE